MVTKTVVELDLVGYSEKASTLEEQFDAALVAQFNEHIQEFVDRGLAAVGSQRKGTVMATTGDGAILTFDSADDAHRFAVEVHNATQKHNAQKKQASAKRWFRVGIATGDLSEYTDSVGKSQIVGTVIISAVRLEASARPGQIVVDEATFNSLSKKLRDGYGDAETVTVKTQTFVARRYTVYSVQQDAPTTVESILGLFEKLHPAEQIDRLVLLIGMPKALRPSRKETAFNRQNEILDWADGTPGGLPKLAAELTKLVSKQ